MKRLAAPIAVLAILSFSTAAVAGSGCGYGVKSAQTPQETVLQTPVPSPAPAPQTGGQG